MASKEEQKQRRLRAILDRAGKELEAEGVQYFLGCVDREGPDGGQAYVQSDIKGENFVHILDMALPTSQDVINLGIWVGQLLQARKTQK